MTLKRIQTAFGLTMLQLVRRRIVIILLFLIPALFYLLVYLTTKETPILFKLATLAEDRLIRVSSRSESLVFIGLACVGFLTSFLALTMVQADAGATRRLILCGYRPSDVIFSKLLCLIVMNVVIGVYISAMLPLLFEPKRFGVTCLGAILCGWTYSAYGLLIGTVFKRELEGILCIVLLANIDAGWLQNPVYFTNAQNVTIIRAFPAYLPSQVGMVGAFTDEPFVSLAVRAMLYGAAFLFCATVIYARRMSVRRNP